VTDKNAILLQQQSPLSLQNHQHKCPLNETFNCACKPSLLGHWFQRKEARMQESTFFRMLDGTRIFYIERQSLCVNQLRIQNLTNA